MADPIVDMIVDKLYGEHEQFPATTQIGFGADALRAYGKDVWKVWGEWTDEDTMDLAVKARDALYALADNLQSER